VNLLSWRIFKGILLNKRHIDYSVVQPLLKNKVLYFVGLINDKLQDTKEWKELARRRMLQRNSLVEFAEIAEKLSMRYVIVKTFKLFPYVPDDVDILVLDRNELNDAITELTKRGFRVRSRGTPEVTLNRVASKTFADLDIHFKMAAGEYVYYPSELIWRNRKKMVISGVELNVASWEDECIITIAHAVIKEFEILASDLLQAMLCEKKSYIKPEYLEQTSHTKTYEVFTRAQHRIIHGDAELPYEIPLWEVALAYIYNVNRRMRNEKLKPVYELLGFPKAKGIKKLLLRSV
jgi:hypothetical protein